MTLIENMFIYGAATKEAATGMFDETLLSLYDVYSGARKKTGEAVGATTSTITDVAGATYGAISSGLTTASSSVGGVFGSVSDTLESVRRWWVLPTILIGFVVVLVAIGYSGLGGPVARVAEREHARARK